jgi:hypothetical protein
MNRTVVGAYVPGLDITVIVEDLCDDSGNPLSTEIKGFYYGEPSTQDNETFYGSLKAVYDFT